MDRDDDRTNDGSLDDFLPKTADVARALDRRAAEEEGQETARKAANNPRLAAALEAANAPPPEKPLRDPKPSERVEYNPAKTVPPRTRRDTLELQPKLVVPSELLDPRHRETARIQRVDGSRGSEAPPSVTAPPAESPVAKQAQVSPAQARSTIEGLGPVSPEGEPHQVVRVERKGSVSTAAMGALKTEEMSIATAMTEPVEVFPDPNLVAFEGREVRAHASVGGEPGAQRTEPMNTPVMRGSSASPPGSRRVDTQPMLAVVPRRRGTAGTVIVFAVLGLVAVVALVRWTMRPSDVTDSTPTTPTTSSPPSAVTAMAPAGATSAPALDVEPPPAATAAQTSIADDATATAPSAPQSRPSARVRVPSKSPAASSANPVAPAPVRSAEPEEFILKKKDDGQR